ncbi:MAG: hypothetical protein K6T92_09565 [Candidatus Rokubacteria bacterium]|nr:hypothetical protein [Candidatus Rokubacteria bacterium]
MPETEPTYVALPLSTLRWLLAGVGAAVAIMLAMLAVEIVILLRVFELLDLVERLAPPG